MTTKSIFIRSIRAVMPRIILRRIKDLRESVKRYLPYQQEGIAHYGIGPTQVYPQGGNFFAVLNAATKEKLADLDLNSATPVASIGTCFAEKFAYFMKEKGYNYICTEEDALAASANWGRVYTIPNLLQIVRYSTDNTYPIVLAESKKGWFDPLRESRIPYFKDRKTAEAHIFAHRRASYEAFTACKLLIITVGQNEAWVDTSNEQVWAKRPPQEILELRKEEFKVREFSFAENIAALQQVITLLLVINPNLKFLFTVSPVASHASFSDRDVISQSFANKCLLRAIIAEVIASKPDKLFYFPSFEMVLCDNPSNFCADNRHVKFSRVDKIFSLLTKSTALN